MPAPGFFTVMYSCLTEILINSILLSIKREKKVGVFIITCTTLVRTLLKLLPF